MIPSVPTPGNHEYAAPTWSLAGVEVKAEGPSPKKDTRRVLSRHWRPQFTLPENGPPGTRRDGLLPRHPGGPGHQLEFE